MYSGRSVTAICGRRDPWIYQLAYLKFYAENKDKLGRKMKLWSGDFLEKLMKDHIHLNFFREYQDCLPQLQEMKDKTIVEYHTRGGVRARIHYVMNMAVTGSVITCTEYMQSEGGVAFQMAVYFSRNSYCFSGRIFNITLWKNQRTKNS